MTTPQPGIFALGTRSHHHLEFDLRSEASDGEIVSALTGLGTPHVTGGATNLVVGFGAETWRRLAGSAAEPAGLADFTEVRGRDGHIAPATQHDVWVWAHGTGTDTVYDTATAVTVALAEVADLADECSCFVYRDSRDLTGFIDGTANPPPSEMADAACVESAAPGAGGSHVIVQKWVHDLVSFRALSVADQQNVFGRTKPDSTALDRSIRPADAHISLAEVHDAEGEERPIYRRSTPYGAVDHHGLLFVGFSAERDRFSEMLDAMFGAGDRALRDRLLDFSTAVSGSFYFAPSVEELAGMGVGDD